MVESLIKRGRRSGASEVTESRRSISALEVFVKGLVSVGIIGGLVYFSLKTAGVERFQFGDFFVSKEMLSVASATVIMFMHLGNIGKKRLIN
jgi:hypothetical protein